MNVSTIVGKQKTPLNVEYPQSFFIGDTTRCFNVILLGGKIYTGNNIGGDSPPCGVRGGGVCPPKACPLSGNR